MKHYAVVGLCFLCCKSALSESRAVESVNYQAGIAFSKTAVGFGGNAKNWGINGVVTLPVAEYFGASLAANYARSDLETDLISCEPQAKDLTAGFFLRDYEKGEFGVSYGHTRSESCVFSSVTGATIRDAQSDHFTAHASYYFSAWTVGASRSRTVRTDAFDDQTSYASSLIAAYYPSSNVSISAAADRHDHSDDYRLRVEFQPGFLGNAASLAAGYGWGSDSRTISIGATFYFDKRHELILRDRYYR